MNRHLHVFGIALIAALSLAAPDARAANCATFTASPTTPTIPTWNPLTAVMQEATFSLAVSATNGSTKSMKLIFVDTNSNASPVRVSTNTGPRYEIYNNDSGALVSFPAGTTVAAANVPTTQFKGNANTATTVNFRVRILANTSPVEDYVGGTVYSETVGLAVQCFKANGSDNGTDFYSAAAPTISLTIPKVLSIVTASPTTINFDNFTTTQQQAVISIKSTSTLNVAVATDNDSQLVRAGAVSPFPGNSVIPYTMTFNGAPITRTAPLTGQTRGGVAGSAYPLQLTLTGGLPSGKLAGTYSDTITLTVTPGQ